MEISIVDEGLGNTSYLVDLGDGRALAVDASRDLRAGDEVDLSGLTLRALATPGHTGEHLSYELLDGGTTLGVFTGGSLIVGGAARTDLLGPEQTEPLARRQFHSLRRLATMPDETPVWPTHGAGSFCSAAPGAERVSTIGAEKAHNRIFQLADGALVMDVRPIRDFAAGRIPGAISIALRDQLALGRGARRARRAASHGSARRPGRGHVRPR